jgi:hypothetical protein
MKAPKLQVGTLTRPARDMKKSRLSHTPKRKFSRKTRKPDSLLKRAWRQVRKVNLRWLWELLKVIATLKGLLP